MADPQGYCEFGPFTPYIIGGEFTLSRGVQPSIARLRMITQPSTDPFHGTLRLRFGGELIDFGQCVTGPHTLRVWRDRTPMAWSIQVYDRRWKWRYPRITGEYNTRRCNGSIAESRRASLTLLLESLLGELDETPDLRNIPEVYPEVLWRDAPVAAELERLCDLAGLVVCPQPNGVTRIDRIGAGSVLDAVDAVTPTTSYTQAVMPSRVELRAGDTHYQSLFTLEAVGIDLDGSIKIIDDLTYKPTDGWSTQWYTSFADVDPQARALAFKSVWRWYRIKSGQDSAIDIKNVTLLQQLAETVNDDWSIGRCPKPVVKGVFWPQNDHKSNTTSNAPYAGEFRILPEYSLIIFEYPVIQWDSDGAPAEADLQLYAAYTGTYGDGEPIRERFSNSVTESIATTEPRVEVHRSLHRVVVQDSPYGSQADTQGEVSQEAGAYLASITATYSGRPERTMVYEGLRDIRLTGAIAQVGWRWGNDRVATTTASEHHEFDYTTPSHQERRRLSRLTQLQHRAFE